MSETTRRQASATGDSFSCGSELSSRAENQPLASRLQPREPPLSTGCPDWYRHAPRGLIPSTQGRALSSKGNLHRDRLCRLDSLSSVCHPLAMGSSFLQGPKRTWCSREAEPLEEEMQHVKSACANATPECGFVAAGCHLKTFLVNNLTGQLSAILPRFDHGLLSKEETIPGGIPIWKIPNFNRHFEEARTGKTPSLYSPPFYTSRHGYKMCARVYLYGDGVGKSSHMSIFFVVMRGEFDALLAWPFHQKVTLTLLDQSPGRKHISDSFMPDPSSSSFQRPSSEMNIASGFPRFISIHTLCTANGYVKENMIFIRVAVDCTGLLPY